MKAYINGNLYDAEKTPIVILFESDEERKTAARNITNMPDRSGVRAFAQTPGNWPNQTGALMEAVLALKNSKK